MLRQMKEMRMNNREELRNLLRAIETIRLDRFPEIPQEIIDEIVLTEFENIDDRTKGQKDCQNALENYFIRSGNYLA